MPVASFEPGGKYGPINRNRCGKGQIWDHEARQCISLVAYKEKYGKLPKGYQNA